jgi:hypothetical protein
MSQGFFCLPTCSARFSSESSLRQHYQCKPVCRDHWNAFLMKQMAAPQAGTPAEQDILSDPHVELQSPDRTINHATVDPEDNGISLNVGTLEPDSAFEPEGTFSLSHEMANVELDDQSSNSDADSDDGSRLSFESEEPLNHESVCPQMDLTDEWEDRYLGAGEVTGQLTPYFARIIEDRKTKFSGNLYHPFTSLDDWSLARWFHEAGVSMSQVDAFMELPFVSIAQNDRISLIRHISRSHPLISPSRMVLPFRRN